jgi:L-fucono-1,5-lactonase
MVDNRPDPSDEFGFSSPVVTGGKDSMRIDAHHHLWDFAARDQQWTDDVLAVRRSFGLEHLWPLLGRHGITGTILVQSVTVPDETPELLELAKTVPEVLGVVGWVDLTQPDVTAQLGRLRGLPGGDRLVGVRHPAAAEADPRWLLRPDVLAGLRQVAGAQLVYDLNLSHHQLPVAIEVAVRVPGLRLVLEHAGMPDIASGRLDPWRAQLSRLADHPNVAVTLSGLVTGAGPAWTPDQLRPYADHVLARFGPGRVMAGSDWPGCLTTASYDEVVTLTHELLSGLTDAERSEVLGGTAVRWYALDR